ncbi:MAG TPA: FtsQ-type POTRA domain-containing protein [Candidatus Binatia bacterium]|nr:FtsQ-type POTRA domain-containing protein [Candidatus Binatia bacterium]
MSRAASRVTTGIRVRRRRRRRAIPWRTLAFATALVTCVLIVIGTFGWAVPGLWSVARSHPYFAITEITVRGTTRVSREQILEWAGVRRGMSVWAAGPTEVRLRLLQHPDLANASVRRDFPRRVVISVKERIPAAIVVLDDLYFVDRAGHVMDRLRDSDSRDLPLITGVSRSDVEDGSSVLLRRAARLIRLCRRDGCGDGISEIHVDSRSGVTLIPLRRPVAIRLGWGAWRGKLTRTMRVLTAWDGQESRVALLDATYPNQVIVQMRPLPRPPEMPKRRGAKIGVRA